MKKLFVVLAILAVAAACAGSQPAAGGSSSENKVPQAPNQSSGDGIRGGTTAPGTVDGPATVPDTVPALSGPPVIRKASLAITVKSGSFASKLSDLRSLIAAPGGYIAGTEAQANPGEEDTTGRIRTGVINFMVPSASFDATIGELEKVGDVQGEHISGTDVSAQYVDLRARLANAEAQRDAMLTLLRGAKTIQDIIAVQNQIGQITGQIEQLKGQIKYLDDNTAYSSVSVTLTESGAPVQQPSSDSWGFATAINMGAHNFVATINYVITALGAVGPLLVLLLLGYGFWRTRRRPAPAAAHHV
jgi:LysM repeat protein